MDATTFISGVFSKFFSELFKAGGTVTKIEGISALKLFSFVYEAATIQIKNESNIFPSSYYGEIKKKCHFGLSIGKRSYLYLQK